MNTQRKIIYGRVYYTSRLCVSSKTKMAYFMFLEIKQQNLTYLIISILYILRIPIPCMPFSFNLHSIRDNNFHKS